MKAIQFQGAHNINEAESAQWVNIETPVAHGRDLLVKIEAIGVNPVDTKVRPSTDGENAILGYDATGVVVAVGDEAEIFSPGDQVYYAGDITRSGSNAEYQLVDERIVGTRPQSLDPAAAAALPLTSITAWEALHDRLKICPDGGDAGKTILIIGGAGGVGSIAIQLAKLAGLTVIATASRPESRKWCLELGADFIINHCDDLQPQIAQLGWDSVDFIANFNNTKDYWETMAELIAPQGHIVLIVESPTPLDISNALKRKSATLHWEFMFTRSMYQTDDMVKQHELLENIARLIDAGKLKTTVATTLTPISPENVRKAHIQLETGHTIGKITLHGWED